MPVPVSAALAGFGFGLSLIVAIGAQNAFVLRQGLRREHVLIVVAICAVTDAVLIMLGVAGLGALIQRAEWLLTLIELVGGVFLLVYGVKAALRAVHPGALGSDIGGPPLSLRTVVLTTLALTILNPHVYLDTVLLLGSVAATYAPLQWWFGVGAMTGSIVWFSALGFGARALRPLFTSHIAWRVLDVLIAVVMLLLSAGLLWSFAQHAIEMFAR